MENSQQQGEGRGFAGKLADPAVRAERARKASAASAAARTPDHQARRLAARADEVSPQARQELLVALVVAEGQQALEKLRVAVQAATDGTQE
jgi:hypothetical protein